MNVIQLKPKNVYIDHLSHPVLILHNQDYNITLPIGIGWPEATSISDGLNRKEPIRPLAHDLLKNILEILKIELSSVVIDQLDRDSGIFHAYLNLKQGNIKYKVDARPSDGVALALRCPDVPIWITLDTLIKSGRLDQDQELELLGSPSEEEIKRFKDLISDVKF